MMEKLMLPFQYFYQPEQRIYFVYLASAFVLAAVPYMIKKSTTPKGSYPNLFNYMFPKQVYLHKSAINDYLFFFSNTLLMILLITPLFSFVSINFANFINNLLGELIPTIKNGISLNQFYLAVGFTFIIGLVSDFAIFFIHYLQHRIPWLWEFHKVHHSAQVLTPITVYRMHPVDNILTISFSSLAVGLAAGISQFFLKTNLSIFNIAGTNLTFIIFYLCAYNLRHSHIWLSYGSFFNRIFISPAQHQIHHSSDKKHFNKNMGFIFAFWDNMFNTLYLPIQKEYISYGINPHENKKFNTFWSLYLMPFINLYDNCKLSRFFCVKNQLSLIVFLLIIGLSLYFSMEKEHPPIKVESIFLEDMTWLEVRNAITTGNTRVIVPTAGVEQNGPHMVLGKHNHVIKYTSARIAEKIGKTLVAPVINYVPEGNIEPPDGHMLFSGTLSISEKIFSDLLKSTASSLNAHGFKTILFIGDSGGNQTTQNLVAQELNELWSSRGVRVIHIDDYYKNNGQVQFLLNKGFSPNQIGNHAGIRDTSELLMVYPKGVRSSLLKDNSTTDILASGADGDSRIANPAIGNTMLNLKINAAVNQINSLLK